MSCSLVFSFPFLTCDPPGRFWTQLPTKADFQTIYYDTLAASIASNSRAELGKDLPNDRTEIIGNKTEGAMLIFLRKLGVDYRELRNSLDKVKTFPFSSAKKRMSTLVRSSGNEGHLYTKGASEIIAEMCNSYLANDGTTQTIDAQMRGEITAQITAMASAGLRTISIAYCPVSNLDATMALEDAPAQDMAMIFIGLVGIRDPPRKVSHLVYMFFSDVFSLQFISRFDFRGLCFHFAAGPFESDDARG